MEDSLVPSPTSACHFTAGEKVERDYVEEGYSIASYLGCVTQYMETVWMYALQYTFDYSRTSRSRALEYNVNTATLVLYRGFKMYGNYRNEVFWDLKLSFVDRTVFAISILILRVHNWRFHVHALRSGTSK